MIDVGVPFSWVGPHFETRQSQHVLTTETTAIHPAAYLHILHDFVNGTNQMSIFHCYCDKADVLRIDALDQRCLRRILGFKWSDFVRNEDVRHATQQPPLSSTVKTRRLSLFGHIARMNESTDASRILFEPPSEVWTKPRGQPRNSWVRTVTNDLANSYTGLPEAREAAQDRVYWRMFTKHSATHS